ncbi:MAG TPA: SBBP repeat-containing protein, partial [Archangium sp.]|nr:SBBP repeat-containing protein [Archangium sp.]
MAASFGNVYTAGYTEGTLGGSASARGFDSFLSKHDAAGNLLWKHQSGTVANDYVTGMAIHDADSSAVSVYVTGYTLGGLDGNTHAGGQDLFLVKYDAQGVRQWTRQLGTSVNDFAQGVATDEVGNVYLTGYTSGELDGNARVGGQDLFVVKYDAAGVKKWTRQLGTSGRDVAQAVATS